jgi:hypothetical protein
MQYIAGSKLYWQNGKDNSPQELMLSIVLYLRDIPDLTENVRCFGILCCLSLYLPV